MEKKKAWYNWVYLGPLSHRKESVSCLTALDSCLVFHCNCKTGTVERNDPCLSLDCTSTVDHKKAYLKSGQQVTVSPFLNFSVLSLVIISAFFVKVLKDLELFASVERNHCIINLTWVINYKIILADNHTFSIYCRLFLNTHFVWICLVSKLWEMMY